MQNNTQYTEEDKIDLRELFSILKRRKKLIWSVTALFTLLALVYVFIAKPVYEVRSMIEVGQIDDTPIDDVNDIKQKLEYQYQVNVKKKKDELPRVSSVVVPKKSKTIFQLTTIAHSNDDAIKYIHTVINKIETDYKEKTDAYLNNQKELIGQTTKDILKNQENLNKREIELETYNSKMISLTSEDAALAGIYALQIGQKLTELQDLIQYISDLNTKKQELKLSITPLKMKQTSIIGHIETLEDPIKPKKKLIVITAFIAGLMFSIFLVFFLVFLRGIKEEDSE